MQFMINNQTINISPSRTDITIHHAAEHGGDKHTSFPFSILEAEPVNKYRSTDFATYWWLGTLRMQINSLVSGKQLELFNA